MKTVFSGIQPSGPLHIGNYLGAIKQWVALQQDYNCLFSIVDLHAITVPYDQEKLSESIREKAGIYLAAGIDKGIIFVQSDVPEHTELQWLLSTITPMSELNRMTQYKDKKDKGANLGLFSYPVLQAADILLYQAEKIPVGEDQKQHIELARDIARKFNHTFKANLKLPESVVLEKAGRIMSLTDPTKKMSKSDTDSSRINLTDSPEAIAKKIMRSVTDNDQTIIYDPVKKPGLSNLLVIYSLFSDRKIEEVVKLFPDYATLKKELANLLIEKLEPFRKMDNSRIDAVLAEGAQKARAIAQKNLKEIKEKMGFDRTIKKC